MDLRELAALTFKVKGGCAVTITSINVPDHTRGHFYGIVKFESSEFGVHSPEELKACILRRLEKQ